MCDFGISRLTQSTIMYTTFLDLVFLGIPGENCIVGMLLKYPIDQIYTDCRAQRCWKHTSTARASVNLRTCDSIESLYCN